MLKLISGSSCSDLCKKLSSDNNFSMIPVKFNTFSDGEKCLELLEDVQGDDVFIFQSISFPSSDNFLELLMLIDASKRAFADRITVVIPYYGYSRQDKKLSQKSPITAKLIADMIVTAGAKQIITVDLHSDQIQGFFSIPVQNILIPPSFIQELINKNSNNFIIVSPDIGGIKRSRQIAEYFNVDLATIDKNRVFANTSSAKALIGEVKHKDCILIDDIVDTAGTLINAAELLSDSGANSITACITHPVFSGNSLQNVIESKIEKVIVSDTIPLNIRIDNHSKVFVKSISNYITDAILCIANK